MNFTQSGLKPLREVCGSSSPEVLFTSEDYGPVMAQYLRCEHLMVDRSRNTFPISATLVRENPWACWEFLDPVVRSYFVKTICVYGPESTGKSTLCEKLAKHFCTVWQPEFAREYLGDRHWNFEDMEIIARGHLAAHKCYEMAANRILFMDTDAITTLVYSRHYYGRIPEFVQEQADQMKNRVALYLFTDIDVEWVAEPGRELGLPHQREMIRKELAEELKIRGIPYRLIYGDWDQRVQRAVAAVCECFPEIESER